MRGRIGSGAHGNFNEYAPLTLVLIAGIVLIVSRGLHAYGMQGGGKEWGRTYGILSTFALLLVLLLADIFMAIF